MSKVPESPCSISRSLGVLGERWTFLILRDAFEGITRFDDFRQSLGAAADVLSARLAALVEQGVMEKAEYREPGARKRFEYVLTDAGRELVVILAALQEWGDRHLPWPEGPSLLRLEERTADPVHVGFIGSRGQEVLPQNVVFVPTASYPRGRLTAQARRSQSLPPQAKSASRFRDMAGLAARPDDGG